MDRERIIEYAVKMEEYINVLYIGNSYIKEDFTGQPILVMGCERAMELALSRVREAAILLSKDRQTICDGDLMDTLVDFKVIPPWLGGNMKRHIWLLDPEVHRLIKMDKGAFYDNLSDYIGDFMHFKKYVLEYVV